MQLSLMNELRNRDPSNVIDEFGDEEEDEAFIKVQEDELKNEIHIYDQISQSVKKEKEDKNQIKKQKQGKKKQDIENNSQLVQIEQQDEEQKDYKQMQLEENEKENYDENNQDLEGDIALLNEELEYDEKEYIKKNNNILRQKKLKSLIAYIQKIKDKADDIFAPIVQKFLYNPDAIIQKIMGDYSFDDIMLFQKYGWSYFEDDDDDDDENEDIFESNKEQQNNKKKKKKKKRQYQMEEEMGKLKYKDTIDDNEEQQMNDLKDDLDRIKKEQDLIEKQRQDDEIKIKLLEEKQKKEQEKEEIELRQIIQMNLDNSESYRKDMEKQDINVINLQEIRRLNLLQQSFMEYDDVEEDKEKGNNNIMIIEDVNVILLTYEIESMERNRMHRNDINTISSYDQSKYAKMYKSSEYKLSSELEEQIILQKEKERKDQIEREQKLQLENKQKQEKYQKIKEQQEKEKKDKIERELKYKQIMIERQKDEELFKKVQDQLNGLINMDSRFPKEMINKLKKSVNKNRNTVSQLQIYICFLTIVNRHLKVITQEQRFLVSIKQHSLHPSLFTDTGNEEILLCPSCLTQQLKLIENAIKCMKRIRNK